MNIVPTVFFRTRSHKGKKRGKEEEATVTSPTEKGEILNGKKREKREGGRLDQTIDSSGKDVDDGKSRKEQKKGL